MDSVAQLRATRRYLTAFLLNLDINTDEMLVTTLLNTLDHFTEHPDEFRQLINDRL